ncbi:MAG: TetR/AcrR family transcriptional regulator [Hyphomonadaceae bacterium]|nr:TetR/AcrR family transcriptional regulator [Hyphomonadaceae bacterium]MBX3511211.1 TetR/AcrR family transcriptional regulator [Hyphomonadaceae bacterium]
MKPRTVQNAPPLDAAQWIEAAFDALAEGGIEAVRVDPLAKQLGVTRGSFYWHFKDRDALHQAMLRQWRERANYMIFNRLERSAESASQRLDRLLALPHATERSSRGAAIELAVRLWAQRDRNAAKAVRHVDRTRLTYFAKLLQQHGVPVVEARHRAFLFYAALMGEAWITTDNREAMRHGLRALLLAKP